ncbi:hypothetical protein CANARDRAFT_29606 [[Candida] arabinofermentans NRRL YB-2248]|uniref:Uncharacterized protein n=1 Tax=[Candida] arabinofermentans NRRL YB-2248 TaxID=983967 RepID=A0A1E4SWJ3_9ASCO|nr:hypothetical protein CANARDRAFT_29606 [[Candida] arabinofermentans NRRL YB-2248]
MPQNVHIISRSETRHSCQGNLETYEGETTTQDVGCSGYKDTFDTVSMSSSLRNLTRILYTQKNELMSGLFKSARYEKDSANEPKSNNLQLTSNLSPTTPTYDTEIKSAMIISSLEKSLDQYEYPKTSKLQLRSGTLRDTLRSSKEGTLDKRGIFKDFLIENNYGDQSPSDQESLRLLLRGLYIEKNDLVSAKYSIDTAITAASAAVITTDNTNA